MQYIIVLICNSSFIVIHEVLFYHMYHKKNNQNISQPCEMGTKKSVNYVKRVPEKKPVNHVKRVPEKNQSCMWKEDQKKWNN